MYILYVEWLEKCQFKAKIHQGHHMPSLENNYKKKPYGGSSDLAIFTTECFTEGSNSKPLDPQLNALTT